MNAVFVIPFTCIGMPLCTMTKLPCNLFLFLQEFLSKIPPGKYGNIEHELLKRIGLSALYESLQDLLKSSHTVKCRYIIPEFHMAGRKASDIVLASRASMGVIWAPKPSLKNLPSGHLKLLW